MARFDVPFVPSVISGEPVESRLFMALCDLALRGGGADFESINGTCMVYLDGKAKIHATHYYSSVGSSEWWKVDMRVHDEYCVAESTEEFLEMVLMPMLQ